MRSLARECGFAVLAWLLPFVAAVAMFPLRESRRMLFESLIAVALAASTVLLGCIYLRRSSGDYVAQGVRIGLVWMVANWALDGLMFSGGPMKMTLEEYVADIGVIYLMIPAITVGLAIAASAAAGRNTATASGAVEGK
jgi:uncharacterized membrane protein YpjA